MSRYAFLVTAGPDRVGSALNGIEYARQLEGAGHTVAIYLDGAATQWPGELETRADHPLSKGLSAAIEKDLVAACGFCAAAFGGADGCRDAGVPLLGESGAEHGPDVAELVADGYTLLSIG